jgi:hypothetical protein
VNAAASYLNADDFAGHTLGLAEVVASLVHGKAPRYSTRREQHENDRTEPHTDIVVTARPDPHHKNKIM